MSPTYVTGGRTTENISPDSKQIDMTKQIRMLRDELSVLATFLMEFKQERAKSNVFKWRTDELPERTVTVNGAIADGVTTTVVVTNSAPVGIGWVLYNPATGERMRVEANNTATNTLTIKRAVGTTAGAAIANTQTLVLLSSAYPQGSRLYAAKTTLPVTLTNNTQIERTPVDITRTEDQIELFEGSDRAIQQARALLVHKQSWNYTLWFGEKGQGTINGATESTTHAGKPVFYTGGLLSYIPSANKDATAALTWSAFVTSMATAFRYPGSKRSRVLFASRRVVGKITGWADAAVRTEPGNNKWGLDVRDIVTPYGDISVVTEDTFDDAGLPGMAVLVEPKELAWRYLQNTTLRTNVNDPDYDGYVDEHLSEAGGQYGDPKNHYWFTSVAP